MFFTGLKLNKTEKEFLVLSHLLDVLFAFVYFLVEFLLLVRRDRSLSLAVGLSGCSQLLLLAGHVVRFLSCLHLHVQTQTGAVGISNTRSDLPKETQGQSNSLIPNIGKIWSTYDTLFQSDHKILALVALVQSCHFIQGPLKESLIFTIVS